MGANGCKYGSKWVQIWEHEILETTLPCLILAMGSTNRYGLVKFGYILFLKVGGAESSLGQTCLRPSPLFATIRYIREATYQCRIQTFFGHTVFFKLRIG